MSIQIKMIKPTLVFKERYRFALFYTANDYELFTKNLFIS